MQFFTFHLDLSLSPPSSPSPYLFVNEEETRIENTQRTKWRKSKSFRNDAIENEPIAVFSMATLSTPSLTTTTMKTRVKIINYWIRVASSLPLLSCVCVSVCAPFLLCVFETHRFDKIVNNRMIQLAHNVFSVDRGPAQWHWDCPEMVNGTNGTNKKFREKKVEDGRSINNITIDKNSI